MRTKAIAVVVAATLLLAACAQPEHQSGDAAPAGAMPPSVSPTTAASTSAPTSASTSASTSPSTTAPSSGATTTLVLGPTGYGVLRLGMTREQAIATGMVTDFENGAGCSQAFIRGRPAGQGRVFLSPDRGVAAIQAWSTLPTAEGLRADMSATEARGLYANWTVVDGTLAQGRHFAKVPGNDKAVFRIATVGSKVQSVTLQLVNQNCYE